MLILSRGKADYEAGTNDDKWAKNRGRIYIDLPYSLDNEKIFEYAQEFNPISYTKL
jgi:hypothetical protein